MEWKLSIWFNVIFKFIFIICFVLWGKFRIKDNVVEWNFHIDCLCSLCGNENEILVYFFFDCELSKDIWREVLKWFYLNKYILEWGMEWKWIVRSAKGKSVRVKVIRMCFSETVCFLWTERNNRLFKRIRTDRL